MKIQDGEEGELKMKPKLREKSNSKSNEFTDDCTDDSDLISISWEASLGKEVQSFWESIDEEFEE